jgi:hypothetical protein
MTSYNPEWTGSLTGDKKWTALFDNSKIKSAVGEFTCSEDLDKILAEPVAVAKRNLELRGAIGAPKIIVGMPYTNAVRPGSVISLTRGAARIRNRSTANETEACPRIY